MQITIELNTADYKDLEGLTALIDALAGRTGNPFVKTSTVGSMPTIDEFLKVRPQGYYPDERAQDHSDEDAEIVAAAVAAGAPAFDSAQIPWDERIHASSRATIADGTWRRRKNTPDELYDSVMAELKGASSEVPLPPAATTSDTPEPPVSEPVVTEREAAVVEPATDDTPAPPADAPDLSSWPKFVQSVQSKDVPESAKTYLALGTLCSENFGAAKFLDMKDKPGSWAMFYDMVG